MLKFLDFFHNTRFTHFRSDVSSSSKSKNIDVTPLHLDWIKTLLVGLPFGAIAFFIGIPLEKLSNQETYFDLLVFPIATFGMVAASIILLLKPQSLRFIVTLICLSLSTFFIAKIIGILFFFSTEVDPLHQMTESFFWLPVFYLFTFLITEIKLSKIIAVVFTILMIVISLIYAWLCYTNGVINWSIIYALVQLNLAMVVSLSLTFACIRFRAEFDATKDQEVIANKLARYDRLTGLYNRLMLQEELERYLDSPTTHNLALLFIDIDGFKSINDSLGHQYGDELLKHIARRLNNMRQKCNDAKDSEGNPNHDIVARMSGDEFVFIIRDFKNQHHVESIASLILNSFKMPFNLSGEHVHITSSIGICFYPEDGIDYKTLLNHADIAMYEAKQSGKNKYCFYTEAMSKSVEEERKLSKDLRLAITKNELELHFQPIINLQNHQIDKFEALLRWKHPERGFVAPDVFIPLAEKAGLIVPIDRWVLQEACKTAQAWQNFLPNVSVAVNMSPVQFGMPDVVNYVLETLKTTTLAPTLLELEVTESVVIDNLNDSSLCLNQLREHGIKTAIDDFGTGYSSLAYLQELPADTVKIDKSFINNLLDNKNVDFTEKLIKVIIGLSMHLNRRVVAEGIETIEQLNWLRSVDCHLGQGYYFSKPIPYSELLIKYGSSAPEGWQSLDAIPNSIIAF